MKIETSYWRKPIPTDRFDWSATLANYEPGSPIGYGATETAAKIDLLTLPCTEEEGDPCLCEACRELGIIEAQLDEQDAQERDARLLSAGITEAPRGGGGDG